MKKRVIGIIAVLMALTLVAGCGAGAGSTTTEPSTGGEPSVAGANNNDNSGKVVKIAVAGPMTGDNAEYGTGFKNAVEQMVNEWNEKGGVAGMQIEVVAFDDKNTGEEAASIAQKIVEDKDVVAVIGHFSSGVCMTASPTYQEYELVNISPSASHPDFTGEGDYIFRNNTVINVEAGVGVDLAVNYLGKTKVGLLSIKTDWGTSTAEITKEIIESQYPNVEIVAHEEVIEGSDDYGPSITKLNSAGAEVIICASMYNTLAPFAKQYKQVNPDIEIVGFSNAYTQQLIELGGAAVEGIVFPIIFFHESPEANVRAFVDPYTTTNGAPPSSLTAQAYDSAGMILQAIEETGSTDHAVIRDTLLKMDYQGVTGSTNFDENGDAMKSFTKAKVVDGKFVEIAE